jgi:hypothetical protein
MPTKHNFGFHHIEVSRSCVASTKLGLWGARFEEFLNKFSAEMAGGDSRRHGEQLEEARNLIAVAHARAVGVRMELYLDKCVPQHIGKMANIPCTVHPAFPAGVPRGITPSFPGVPLL